MACGSGDADVSTVAKGTCYPERMDGQHWLFAKTAATARKATTTVEVWIHGATLQEQRCCILAILYA
jgi:hypothetical protein